MSSFIYGSMPVYQYLVVSFVLHVQGLNGTVTYVGTYDTFVSTCNLTGDKSTIYQLTSAALGKANISSTWLPIRRRHLSGWYWLSGAYYDAVLCSDHKYNMMCGVLRAADKLLDCAECNRTYTKFLCQTRVGFVPGVASNCGQECLNVSGESYILYNQSGTWYDAKRLCMKENQQLASLDRETSRELLEKLQEKNRLYSDIWVGLREVDYFWHQENKSIFEYNWRRTDPCPCDTENECVILVMYSSNIPYWRPENCSSSINFTCSRKEAAISQLVKTKDKQLFERSQRIQFDSTYKLDESLISSTIFFNITVRDVSRGSTNLSLCLLVPVGVLLMLIAIVAVCIFLRNSCCLSKSYKPYESAQVSEWEELKYKDEKNSGNECLPDDKGDFKQEFISSGSECIQEAAQNYQQTSFSKTGKAVSFY